MTVSRLLLYNPFSTFLTKVVEVAIEIGSTITQNNGAETTSRVSQCIPPQITCVYLHLNFENSVDHHGLSLTFKLEFAFSSASIFAAVSHSAIVCDVRILESPTGVVG